MSKHPQAANISRPRMKKPNADMPQISEALTHLEEYLGRSQQESSRSPRTPFYQHEISAGGSLNAMNVGNSIVCQKPIVNGNPFPRPQMFEPNSQKEATIFEKANLVLYGRFNTAWIKSLYFSISSTNPCTPCASVETNLSSERYPRISAASREIAPN